MSYTQSQLTGVFDRMLIWAESLAKRNAQLETILKPFLMSPSFILFLIAIRSSPELSIICDVIKSSPSDEEKISLTVNNTLNNMLAINDLKINDLDEKDIMRIKKYLRLWPDVLTNGIA